MKNIRYVNSGLFLVTLICLVTVLTFVIIFAVGRINNIRTLTERQETLPIMVTIDDGDYKLVSAQLMLINVNTKSVAMLDIPPYLAAVLNNDDLDRVDRSYNDANIEVYLSEVSKLVNLPINWYLRLPGNNIEQLVDLLGGIRMFILGESGVIQSVPSGEVILDGRKILNYIDYYRNNDNSDIAVDNLQQFFERFIISLKERRQDLTNPTMMRYFMRLVDTNLNRQEIATLLDILVTLESERFSAWKTQGNLRSVRVNDQRELLLFPYFSGRWLEDTLLQIQASLQSDDSDAALGDSISLSILNGTELSGLARRTKLLFEQYGFEVSRIGDAESNEIANTIIYDHGTNAGAAQRVAQIIQATLIEEQPLIDTDNSSSPDITLILGSDFDGLYVRN